MLQGLIQISSYFRITFHDRPRFAKKRHKSEESDGWLFVGRLFNEMNSRLFPQNGREMLALTGGV